MTAAVYVPLWTLGVAFIALCFIPDVLKFARRCLAGNGVGRLSPRAAGTPFDWDAEGWDAA